MKRVIYPATRAVEHAASLPGVVPLRLFPVLLPVWQVDTSAEVYEQQHFEVIDQFVLRAIEEGAVRDHGELAAFLHLPAGLVQRCLAFLRAIGHVTGPGPQLELTDLGRKSLNAGIRYAAKTTRQTILVERHTGWPLPRTHYDAGVAVLDTPHLEDGDQKPFLRLFTLAGFEPKVLSWLENNPDKASFNLPGQLRHLRHDSVREGFLPSYLVETTDGEVLAYCAAGEQRDEFLERVFATTAVRQLIQAQEPRDQQEVWRGWLAQSPAYRSGRLEQLPGGQWRVVLDASAFGDAPKVPRARLGTYEFHEHYFLQVCCEEDLAD